VTCVDIVGTIAPMGETFRRSATASRTVAAIEDRELAARLMAGDQAALADVYDRYVGLVFGMARRVLGDEAKAEDVTQEVFVYVWEQPHRFDPSRASLRSWLGLLAHHRSVDRVRADVRRTRGEARVDPIDVVTASTGEVDDELSVTWLAGRVREALDQLPAEQRDAVVLAYFGGRTYRQVATDLEIPEGTAKSRLRLALAKLDDLLRPSLIGEGASVWT
jgi:RNA polymerase sigma-70 factor (ECF subfamily)